MSVVESTKGVAETAKVYGELDLTHSANNDMWVGMAAARIWGTLGWHDIKQRYRRSMIGPFWFTLSTAIVSVVLGILYSTLFQSEIAVFLPYIASGLVIWQYLGTTMTESCEVYHSAGYLIKQIRLPLTIHAGRMVWRNFLIFCHGFPVVFLLLVAFERWPGVEALLAIPGLLILMLHGFWISTVLGIMCSRFRDIPPIIANLVQVSFFFTPIFWMPEVLTERAWIVEFNPFYHVIEVVRAPILGRPILMSSWIWSVGLLIGGYCLAWMMMKRYRDRVPYWL